MSVQQAYLDLVAGRPRGPAAALLRAGLSGLAVPYGGVTRLRNALYDRGWLPAVDLGRPTVSVGNLTVGGTGKTPVIAHVAAALAAEGHRPAVLMRGYKAEANAKGDEHRLLEELLGDAVPVEADADRAVAARRVLARRPDLDVFLLDDAFQHRRARRDFDLVLVDATQPFGHGRHLPRGLLRESVAGLRRASAVLLTRADHVPAAVLTNIATRVRRQSDAAIFQSAFAPGPLLDADRRVVEPAGQRVITLCGLGNPAAFAHDVAARGLVVAEELRYADHHAYAPQNVAAAAARVRQFDAAAVVTSGKDWVKLRRFWPDDMPVWVAQQRVDFAPDDASALLAMLLRVVA